MGAESTGITRLREAFDYPLSRLYPFGDHIDPPSVAIYETLVVKGPDGTAQPGLAESWEISEDKLEWRFWLRAGARFHSGDRCDAAAVVEALHFLRWGHYDPPRQLWYWDPVDRVWAEGEETVVVGLHFPYVRLPSLFWGTHTAIYNQGLRAREPEQFGRTIADGTGPFRLVSWSQERAVVERWDGYAGSKASFLAPPASGGPREIEWISMLDPKERVAALERGEVDCLHGPDYEDIAQLEADPRFTVSRFSQASNAYLALNWERTDLDFTDLCVRRGISLAIDRSALVRDALLGYGAPTFGPFSPGNEFYDAAVETGREHDPAESARLLDSAGWTVGAAGVREKDGRKLAFECVLQDDAIHKKIAAGMRDQLLCAGINLLLKPVLTFEAFYKAAEAGAASFINKWLWQDIVDAAIGFTATWGGPDPNWQHAAVPALDAAYHEWLRAETPEALQAAASKAQIIVADELPLIPLLVPQDVWVSAKRVHGWDPTPAILYPFYHSTTLAD